MSSRRPHVRSDAAGEPKGFPNFRIRAKRGSKHPRRGAAIGSSIAAALGAVAALELLARAAPARVVAADGARLVVDHLRGGRRRRDRGREPARGGDHLGAGRRLVLVGKRLRSLRRLQRLLRLVDLYLDMEQRRDDLFANQRAQLLEHGVAFAAVLDEGFLLRHCAEVEALAEIVHRLEVLAPTRVDDLEDDEPLDVPRELRAEGLLALVVGVERVLAELLDEGLAGYIDLFAELGDGDVTAVERGHLGDE